MATLVFTAVGTALGGPIGGMIGAMIGQQVDGALFAPKARQGPRLGDLAVQTSSYGTPIPKIFGTVRAAGTVIWATDLKESRSTSGGGKGKPKVTSYSYSASFAVAISGRRIADVRRIWADGKLLRGAAGDFKSRTKYRLYRGSEEQAPDALIASREGIGATPAFRGIAYAVFEDFQLADYGNRIPSLTFEIVADGGEVAVAAMASELSDGAMAPGGGPAIGGYAASGESVAGAIAPLIEVMPLSLAEAEGGLRLGTSSGAPLLIAETRLGAATPDKSAGRTEFSRRAPGLTAGNVTIAYHDPARDYQTGLQRAFGGETTGRAERRALPATLPAATAKGLADYRLKSIRAERERARLRLGWRDAGIMPGAALRLEGRGGLWRVSRTTFEAMIVTADLVRMPGGAPQPIGASPGRSTGEEDATHGRTLLVLADLSLGEESGRNKPLLVAAAAGTEPGWRQAELILSYDGGMNWEAAGMTAPPAVIGRLTTALAPAGSTLLDLANDVEVQLPHDGMWIESCDDDGLAAGRNLALIGRELVQFGTAEPLGGGAFRLSRLLRGRRGTEWAAGADIGAPFLLIEAESLVSIEPPAALAGTTARIVAQGIGDDMEGVSAECVISGEAIRPPAPVHLRIEKDADGDVQILWTRRGRTGWGWLDGGDVPLGEEAERYEVRLSAPGFERRAETAQATFIYSAAEQAADGWPFSITVEIVQIGTFARSRPAIAAFQL